jgi:protein tyrosine/serine phosphatase
LNLEFIPFLSELEERKAKKYSITVITALMSGSPIAPSEKHVKGILLTLRDKRYHPIYFHCALGRDRTSLIAALYKMYFRGMSQQDAWQEMKAFGFKDSWTLGGLKHYFEKHPAPPPSLMDR